MSKPVVRYMPELLFYPATGDSNAYTELEIITQSLLDLKTFDLRIWYHSMEQLELLELYDDGGESIIEDFDDFLDRLNPCRQNVTAARFGFYI